jgi:cytochrome P450
LQQQLREEAQTLGTTGSYAEQLDNLHCASRCIDEGMRVFAPATLVQRVAMRDAFLDDVLIPKGTVIGICAHSVHADEKVWEDARRFNPMRPSLDYETSEGYISFGGGPRGCPGTHTAMAICKVALPLIVSKFQLADVPMRPPSQQCRKVPKFVEWSVDGIPLRLLPVSR